MTAGVRRVLDPSAEDPVLREVVNAGRPAVHLQSWQGLDQISAVAVLSSEGSYALAATFVHDDVVRARGTSSGSVEAMVDELARLLPTAGHEPRHDGPDAPLSAPDLLTLRDLIRRGEDSGVLARAVADIGLPAVPGWVLDVAEVTGGATIGTGPGAAAPTTLLSATATAHGWVGLSVGQDGLIHGVALSPRALRDRLLDAAVLLATGSAT